MEMFVAHKWLNAFLIAIAFYILFLLFVFFKGYFRENGRNPFERLVHAHVLSLPIFVGVCGFSYAYFWLASAADVALALFIYMTLHYAAFMNFFAMLRRGFSLNILVTLADRKRVSESVIFKNYANGQGLGYVISKRINSMFLAGLITTNEVGKICMTSKGRWFLKFRNICYKLFRWQSVNL